MNPIRITTTNENWRGKNDPAERRRIQNRLNQRAFRERQRAGESAKPYRPRSTSVATSQSPESQRKGDSDKEDSDEDEDDDDGDEADSDDDDGEDDDGDEDEDEDEDDEDEEDDKKDDSPSSSCQVPMSIRSRAGQAAGSASQQPTCAPPSGQAWDELARLINRNFMQAAVTNAQHLGLDLAALRAGTPVMTPRLRNSAAPATLAPIELQYQLLHDPLIDTIPHPRLRFNVLKAIATQRLDAVRLSACLRRSGALTTLQGEQRRGGLIVWSAPEQLSSWELSEGFVALWAFLLEGCEDFIAATNVWRSRRNERTFPTTVNTTGVLFN